MFVTKLDHLDLYTVSRFVEPLGICLTQRQTDCKVSINPEPHLVSLVIVEVKALYLQSSWTPDSACPTVNPVGSGSCVGSQDTHTHTKKKKNVPRTSSILHVDLHVSPRTLHHASNLMASVQS